MCRSIGGRAISWPPATSGGTDAFPNKGAQIGRRNENSEIVPYHDRGAIEDGRARRPEA